MSELDENIGNDGTLGLFIFVDQALSAKQCPAFSYPAALYSELNKKLIGSMLFQAFKKQVVPAESNTCQVFNREQWRLNKLHGEPQTNVLISPLTKEIDKKALSDFVGRSTDLKNIIKEILILQNEGGVFTIKGSGGIGKTHTVKKAALLLAERHFFKDGIYFVDCEFLTEFRLFESRLFEPFNLEQAQNAKAHLAQHYHKQDTLIILDNFETILHQADAQQYIELLSFVCDYATVILTSRELLEQDWEKAHELNRMSTDEAEQLFLQGIVERKFTSAQKKLLREDIIENLLDNNPLAIRLITRSMPKGKDLDALKTELTQDIFSKVSEQELLVFDAASDSNIEKKRSLYGCINYSYALLSTKEQLKLQSIMGKFAEQKLQQRQDLAEVYKNAFEYNNVIAGIGNSLNHKDEIHGDAFMAYWQNNFIRCIGYLDQFESEQDELVDFLDDICNTFVHTCREHIMLNAMSSKRQIFTDKHLLLFDLITIHLRYFSGDFDDSFSQLQTLLPMQQLEHYSGEGAINRMILLNSLHLYRMEGEDFFTLKQYYRTQIWHRCYPSELFCLGAYHQTLFDLSHYDFFSFEIAFNSGQFSSVKLNNYISKQHKKAHLQRMQLSYIKVKAGDFVKDEIAKLVEVNPYTTGLKQLMFALHEPDVAQAKSLYQSAAENLKHIKYYYVEALYFYARFLQQETDDLYAEIYQLGLSLATKHWFRFLIYQFESLVSPKSLPYHDEDYPLPDDMQEQVDGYIQFCINCIKEIRK